MEQPVQADSFELVISDPLSLLIAECAVYCQVDCCGVSALDENAYQMLRWVQMAGEEKTCQALQQLRTAIDQVSIYDGPIAEKSAFCETWQQGSECAKYLTIWHQELSRAIVFTKEGCPSPAERLRLAKLCSDREYSLEVRRLAREANRLSHLGNKSGALLLYSLIAELDSTDRSIADEVAWTCKFIAESANSKNDVHFPNS